MCKTRDMKKKYSEKITIGTEQQKRWASSSSSARLWKVRASRFQHNAAETSSPALSFTQVEFCFHSVIEF